MSLFPGYVLALFEVALWFLLARYIRKCSKNLKQMNSIAYYWFTFTILTGFWESVYLSHYKYITGDLATDLVKNHTHVWFKKYDPSYVLPWKFSEIFYAEYGAWADREYMSEKDSWSHQIEGSHMTYCAVFCLWALLANVCSGVKSMHFTYANAFAMGAQYMNSLLYMGEYSLQVKDPDNVNYNSDSFPLGKFWSERPFMYINIFWMLFPALITIQHLVFQPNTKSTTATPSSKLSISADDRLPPYSLSSGAIPMTSVTKPEDKKKKYGGTFDWQETQFLIVNP